MGNEDLPPSSGWASILIWNKYATNSGLIEAILWQNFPLTPQVIYIQGIKCFHCMGTLRLLDMHELGGLCIRIIIVIRFIINSVVENYPLYDYAVDRIHSIIV